MPTPNEYRGFSTATGTTSITIPVPAGTADGDGLVLAIRSGDTALSIPGWTLRAGVAGTAFAAWTRMWHTGDPTSVTVTPPGATAIVALMYGFEGVSMAGGASNPSGGTDPTKIECPVGTFGSFPPDILVVFGEVEQATPLIGDPPLVEVENVANGLLRLVGGFATSDTTTSKFFSGVTNPGSRSGLGVRVYGPLTYPGGGGWGVGMVRMGAN